MATAAGNTIETFYVPEEFDKLHNRRPAGSVAKFSSTQETQGRAHSPALIFFGTLIPTIYREPVVAAETRGLRLSDAVSFEERLGDGKIRLRWRRAADSHSNKGLHHALPPHNEASDEKRGGHQAQRYPKGFSTGQPPKSPT